MNYAHGIDEEKSQEFYPRKVPLVEHGEVGGNRVANDNTHPKLIPLDGCSASEAVTFLTERKCACACCISHLYLRLNSSIIHDILLFKYRHVNFIY